MPRSITYTYSRYSRAAAALLAGHIRAARTERLLITQEVADRAGISRGLLQRIGGQSSAIPIYAPELPLQAGALPLPEGLTMPGSIRDAAPPMRGVGG